MQKHVTQVIKCTINYNIHPDRCRLGNVCDWTFPNSIWVSLTYSIYTSSSSNCGPTCWYVAGVQGIVEAYRMALPQVKLYGPTNFSPIINHVAGIASGATQQNNASVSLDHFRILHRISTHKKWKRTFNPQVGSRLRTIIACRKRFK